MESDSITLKGLVVRFERKRRESNPQNPGQRFMDYKSSGLADARRFRLVAYKLH